MHEYPLLFEGTGREEEAKQFAKRVKDVSVFLAELGIIPPPALPLPLRVAYHDACHLAHAQRVTVPPRRLLAGIPNVTLVEIPDGEFCCGSAGTYNLEQPEIAARLGQRKAANIAGTGADVVAAGNIGCMVQIRNHLAAQGRNIPVLHTVELLARAYANGEAESKRASRGVLTGDAWGTAGTWPEYS